MQLHIVSPLSLHVYILVYKICQVLLLSDIIPAPVFRYGIVIGPRKGIGEAVGAENPFLEDTASVWLVAP